MRAAAFGFGMIRPIQGGHNIRIGSKRMYYMNLTSFRRGGKLVEASSECLCTIAGSIRRGRAVFLRNMFR